MAWAFFGLAVVSGFLALVNAEDHEYAAVVATILAVVFAVLAVVLRVAG